MKKTKNVYDIGLDIGTGSVGYAVINDEGKLYKKKGNNMWGSRIFSNGSTAQERRLYRGRRRLSDRKKRRILLLQDLLKSEIDKVDSNFYLRLKESKIVKEDSVFPDMNILFNDPNYTDKDHHLKYPSIYHLRQELVRTHDKKDIREIYLALHHIVKHRGNFLYEGQNIGGSGISIRETMKDLLIESDLKLGVDKDRNEDTDKITDLINSTSMRKADKKDAIINILIDSKETKDFYKALIGAIFGYKVDFKKIFPINDERDFKFSLSDKDVEGRMDGVLEEEYTQLYHLLEKAYSGIVLGQILSGENVNYISDAMVARYDKHKKDLMILKDILKFHFKKEYKNFFDGDSIEVSDDAKNQATTYGMYIRFPSKHTQEELMKNLKSFILGNNAIEKHEFYSYVVNEISEGNFLSKLRIRDNGVIPYQLHSQELKAILDNQSVHYPLLKEISNKLISLVEFRIPYYVGPLSNPGKENKFSWMVRRGEGKIYPWNFEEMVDIDASAEKFIERMRNTCSYLPAEDVIPKNSLLYAEYEVLSEINQITVNGKRLSTDNKLVLFEEVFKSTKKVTKTRFKEWLKMKKLFGQQDLNSIEGFQTEEGFASSYGSYIDFSRIMGGHENVEKNRENIEKIILWISLFEDKVILKRKVSSEMQFLTAHQINEICKLNYKGWSRLSKKLLTGLKHRDKFGNLWSIMDYLRNSDYFFMQLVTSDKLDFKGLIEKESSMLVKDKIGYEMVDALPCSPSVKKGIWQSLKIVEEIKKIMGSNPRKIFVEFAREDQESRRTKSRYKKLEEMYTLMRNDKDYKEIYEELKSYSTDQKAFDDRALYLYFMQNGKCLYSGKRLEISSLQNYEIDHIIPQSYIKDDSFDNLALVIRTYNQRKSDSLLLDFSIQENMKSKWGSLLKNGFITKTKYDKLMRSHFCEDQLKRFINRQLVETRQIVKHTTNIFKREYKTTQVYAIKAALTSNLRSRYGLYKIRDINRYHHAHDAFLAATIGQYILKCYPFGESEIEYDKYKKHYNSFSLKDNYGVVIDRLGYERVDKESGELLWSGIEKINYARKALNFKDCYISRKVETQTGAYYKETIFSPKSGKKIIAMNSRLDPMKYGGYLNIYQSYYCIIEYPSKKKLIKKMVGIPIMVSDEEKTKPGSIHDYLEKNYHGYKMLKSDIKKYQKIRYEDDEWYLVSHKEAINAKELILPEKYNLAAYWLYTKPEKVDDNILNELYKYLTDKIGSEYHCFRGVAKKMNDVSESYLELEKMDKVNVLKQIFILLQTESSNGNFEKFKLGGLRAREGRLDNMNFDISKMEFIDSSVTGMYERRYKL